MPKRVAGTVNIDRIKKDAESVNSNEVWQPKELENTASQEFRIVMPKENVPNGLPYLEVSEYWFKISDKWYKITCPSSLGGEKVIEKSIQKLIDNGEAKVPEIDALKATSDFSNNNIVYWVGYLFDFEYDGDDVVNMWAGDITQPEAYTLRGQLKKNRGGVENYDMYSRTLDYLNAPEGKEADYIKGTLGTYEPIVYEKLEAACLSKKARILGLSVSISRKIQAMFSDPKIKTESGFSIACDKEGYNLIITKGLNKKQVTYALTRSKFPMEISEKMADLDNVPDIVEIVKKDIPSENFIDRLVRAYFLGEEAPDMAEKHDVVEKPEPKGRRSVAAEPKAETRQRVVEPEVKTDAPVRTSRVNAAISENRQNPAATRRTPPAETGRKILNTNIGDDLNDME